MLIMYHFESGFLAEQRTENPCVGGSISPLTLNFQCDTSWPALANREICLISR